jgi:hypothetical protein
LLTREKPLAEDFRQALNKPMTIVEHAQGRPAQAWAAIPDDYQSTEGQGQGRAEICCNRAMGLP